MCAPETIHISLPRKDRLGQHFGSLAAELVAPAAGLPSVIGLRRRLAFAFDHRKISMRLEDRFGSIVSFG
jgi:hypothetical protein